MQFVDIVWCAGKCIFNKKCSRATLFGQRRVFFYPACAGQLSIAILIHISRRLPERGLIGHNFNWLLGQSILLPIGY